MAVAPRGLPFLTALFCVQATLFAEEPAGREVNSLDLGFDTAQAGTQVFLPITLTVPAGIRVGRTENEIAFPTRFLSFEEAKKGVSAQLAEAKLSTVLQKNERNPENSTLKLIVTAAEGKSLTGGVVAVLVFKISEAALPEQTITLKNVAGALTSDDPARPIEPLTGKDGEVKVAESPSAVFGCFFYMH